MKIAIKGHESRGKEVIQILESLGGKNKWFHRGTSENCFYELHDDCIWCANTRSECFKYYTLEEFETQFPFKIGDEVIIIGLPDFPKIITKMVWDYDEILYTFEGLNNTWFGVKALKKFEMKEERNITLTLDKAKEWYNKGGELKEIALQAFKESELNPLPRSWEEYTDKMSFVRVSADKLLLSSLPEKYIALYKLEQLRDCYNNSSNDTNRIAIINNNGNLELYVNPPFNCFLAFKNHLLAREFFSNFKEIIEIAKELI